MNCFSDIGSVSVGVVVGVAIFDLLDLVRRCGTIAGIECSSQVGDDFWEPTLVVSRLVDLVGHTNSDKMGNKEFKDGCCSFNDGIS